MREESPSLQGPPYLSGPNYEEKYQYKQSITNMGNPKAFLTIHRQEAGYRPVHERIDDFSEVEQTLNSSDRRTQASRCMDCGVPFCHWACPLGNKQPEWQDLLYKGRWREAFHVLEQTCDFPEFTGRICPALCEKSCVLKLSCDEPVTIRENEASIVEAAFREGYIQPVRPIRNGKRVAVIGSGPAGLTAANQLNRRGYEVTVFEKYELPGGLLRFGIPNFKLGKNIIDRRIRLMEQEGIVFKVNTMVGNEVSAKEIASTFDAVCIAIGSEVPRDLPIEGRNLKGVHFALELLSQQNRILEGIVIPPKDIINCKGKKILIIGGGDTGSDCVGTANRHKAANVTQIEIMPQPPVGQQFPECQAGIDREGDDVGAVEQVVLAQCLDDLLGREVFAPKVGKRFHFQHQPGVGFGSHQAQIGVQRRDVLSVGKHDRGDLLQRTFLHVDFGTLVYTVVVYDQLVVGSQPYVHFRAEGPDRIGFGERSK